MPSSITDIAALIRKKFSRDSAGAEMDHYRRELETADDDTLQMMHDVHQTNVHINREMKRRGMGKK